MATNLETIRLQRQLVASINRDVDDQTRDLVKAWAIAWSEISPDLTTTLAEVLATFDSARITRGQLQRSIRLQRALAVVATRLDELADQAGVRILGDLQGVLDRAGSAQASIIDSQLPPGADLTDLAAWATVNPDQLAAIVQRITEQITSRRWRLSGEAYQAVRRELVRSVAAGSNPRVAARRMVARARHGFNGGLTRAMVIARTEMLDAHRAAAQLAQEQHTDVLDGWVWLASLRPRTCRACLSMHGRVFGLEVPGPQGHQQCRCSRMPHVKPWADLGFDDVDEPPSLIPDADAFFDSLTPAQQQDLLGPAGYDAWRAGDFPREQWAKVRKTDGWRDSIVPAAPGETNAADLGDQLAGTGIPEPDPRIRQAALPVDFHGEQLEPHEVAFVERFTGLGHDVEWIPRGANGRTPSGDTRATNDFTWTSNGGLEVELKSTRAKHETIRRAIADAVKSAARTGVAKENFVIDLGDQELTPRLLEQLARYNQERQRYQISRLWVLAGTTLTEVALDNE